MNEDVFNASLRQLAAGSDVIVTMLPTSKIVSHVLAEAEDSILAGIRPGTIVIEMSSGEPTVTPLARQIASSSSPRLDTGIWLRCAQAESDTARVKAMRGFEISRMKVPDVQLRSRTV